VSVALYAGVAVAGSLDARTRFVLDGVIRAPRDTDATWADLPLGTPLINISGSELLGLLTGLVIFHGVPPAWQVVAGTGFCGGYTTFSTAAFESIRLAQQQHLAFAAVNAVACWPPPPGWRSPP
jgi:CrcB protein